MTRPAEGGGAPAAAAGPLSRAHRATTLPVLAFICLVAFESIAVATAMPVAAADLGAVRSYGLAFSSFLTASLLGTVLAGGWADARGPRGPMAAGALLFVAGQSVCALAPAFGVLLAGRLLAGAGGGLVVVSVYVVVGSAYPDEVRPRVFGWMSACWVLPGVAGPALAGWMADAVSWRLVFAVVVPLAVLVAAVILPRVAAAAAAHAPAAGAEPAGSGPGARQRAVRGLVVAAGAGALQAGAEGLGAGGAGPVLLTAAGAAAVLAALPGLLPAGALRLARGLPSVVVVRGLFTAAFFGTETFVPLMLQSERGFSASQAGLVLTGGTLGWFAGTTSQARALDRLPRAALLVAGGAALTCAIALLSVLTLSGASGWWVLAAWLPAGFGMGLGVATTSVLTLRLASPAERGLASSALQLSDNLGCVLGIAAAGGVFAALHTGAGRDQGVFGGLYAGLALVAVAAALAGARTRAPRPAAPRPAQVPGSSTVGGP
ncbi:MFS transporter [Kineococcus sp. SYSU DK005]|uniref:MFS transporter n=1 Tax=Kineococcus sp. SYSU DK005 TaxID=3383126 RepID=UPI003D7D6978